MWAVAQALYKRAAGNRSRHRKIVAVVQVRAIRTRRSGQTVLGDELFGVFVEEGERGTLRGQPDF
jgi:hypothetical protein